MVGIDRSLSHGQNRAQERPSPYCRKNLTCRLCGRVMLNTQDLIVHIETHLAQDQDQDLALRFRQNQQNHHIQNQPPNMMNIPPRPNNNLLGPNPNFRPNFPLPPQQFFPGPVVQRPMAMRPGNNISLTLGGGSTQINIISRPPNVPPQVSASARNGGQLLMQAPQSTVEETPGDDVTRPFLEQLMHPIPKVGVSDLEEENGDKLDLTLKL